MNCYVEVLFLGPRRDRGFQIFPCTEREMRTIEANVLALEDGEAPTEVRALFQDIITRPPAALAGGDRQAEIDRGRLVSLEHR